MLKKAIIFIALATAMASTAVLAQGPGGSGLVNPSGAAATIITNPLTKTSSSAPTSSCNTNSITTAFNCDLSGLGLGLSNSVTGVATLGQPSSGYMENPNLSNNYSYLYNTSGWNQSTSGNGGRTNVANLYLKGDQYGQGDITLVYGKVFVDGAKAGATSFLANPAGGIMGGGVSAGAAGVYLQPLGDLDCSDNGFDVACIGGVWNLNRSVATGALGATWLGLRVQSTGSSAIDAIFSGSGLANTGLELSNANFGTNQAAISLSANQRIYGNVSAGNFFPSSLSNSYITYSSSASGWQFVAGGATQLTISNTYVGVINASSVNTGDHFGVVGSSAGALGMTVDNSSTGTAAQTTLNIGNSTATNEAGIILNGGSFSGGQGANALQIKNSGASPIVLGTGTEVLKIGSSGGWNANGSVATAMSSLGPTGSHATIQEWFTVTDSSGNVRYIPAF